MSRFHVAIGTRAQSAFRRAVLMRDGFRCRVCGKLTPKNRLQAHHVIPLESGGPHHPDNGIAVCREPCHFDLHRAALTPEQQAWAALVSELVNPK